MNPIKRLFAVIENGKSNEFYSFCFELISYMPNIALLFNNNFVYLRFNKIRNQNEFIWHEEKVWNGITKSK